MFRFLKIPKIFYIHFNINNLSAKKKLYYSKDYKNMSKSKQKVNFKVKKA